MGATTLTAGVSAIMEKYLPKGDFNGYLNAVLTAIMIACVLIVFIDASVRFVKIMKNKRC
jgi:hypothetical protein